MPLGFWPAIDTPQFPPFFGLVVAPLPPGHVNMDNAGCAGVTPPHHHNTHSPHIGARKHRPPKSTDVKHPARDPFFALIPQLQLLD